VQEVQRGAAADFAQALRATASSAERARTAAIDRANTPATTRFADLARARPVAPVVMASTAVTLP
jgi:nucleoside-diphosphate-sugar epimerase